ARRRLDPGREEVLRMARRERLPLAKALDLLEREVVTGQMERGVLEDAGVARGEDETVAVGPVGVRRVRAQEVAVDDVGHRRQRHRRSGMPGICLLYGVHRKRADCLDRQLFDHFRVLRHVTATIPTWLFLSPPA